MLLTTFLFFFHRSEGQQCGLILVLSMFAQVGMGVPTSRMNVALDSIFGPDSNNPFYSGMIQTNVPKIIPKDEYIVVLNGTIFGTTARAQELEASLLRLRRSQNLPCEMRIVWYREPPMSRYIYINTDCSVAIRPVFIVDALHKVQGVVQRSGAIPSLWKHLMSEGCVEFIDCEEQNARNLLVAVKAEDLRQPKPWTHLEIDPTTILGLMAQLIPFSHMNQSPRNMYWSSMGKQAIAMPCLAYNDRVGKFCFASSYYIPRRRN